MSSSLLHPPTHLSPRVALQLSQQAPALLRVAPSSSIFAAAETPELWMIYENLMQSCLRTGDERSASLCLERLTNRFGAQNERVMALRGIFQEATAENDAALANVLKEYETILQKDPSNMPVTKRRIALLRSLNRVPEAVAALNQFLDSSPTDAEAWAELADLYVTQGMYQQGIFALEEVLLITPNAWNIHARLGEVLYIASTVSEANGDKYLTESLRRFCRSVELCDDYLRGYYDLKITSSRLLRNPPQGSHQAMAASGRMDTVSIERLNELATAKLSEIVRRSASGEIGWRGYDQAEVIAARALLDQDSTPLTR